MSIETCKSTLGYETKARGKLGNKYRHIGAFPSYISLSPRMGGGQGQSLRITYYRMGRRLFAWGVSLSPQIVLEVTDL